MKLKTTEIYWPLKHYDSREKTELTVFAWEVIWLYIKNIWVKPPGEALKEFWGRHVPLGPWNP